MSGDESIEVNGVDDSSSSEPNVEVKIPAFSPLRESAQKTGNTTMDRFYDVNVPVWAELGRIEMTLGDLMKLDEGSVVRLQRPVSDPVDLVSQGVRLARGEVVVIDDCFAVRIKEIESSR
jgi:flagellar motor switch protein FliN/FliY